jgi:large subunit ribosomal protein L18
MDRLTHKTISSRNRAIRTRSTISGSAERPRLSVHVSNIHVSAQIIDDDKKTTLVYATTVGQKIEGNLSQKAAWVGKEIALKAKKAKIKKVVFDRGSRKYHGRVKCLADAARAEGMEF